MRFNRLVAFISGMAMVSCTSATEPHTGTPGAEGSLKVEPVATTTNVSKGTSRAQILPFSATASGSDLKVERIKVDFGTNINFLKVFSRVYITQAGAVLASSDLNLNTVVKEADGRYTITLSGMTYIVLKGASRTFTIEMDVSSAIDPTITSTTVRLPVNGLRAVDGAGIDLYGPTQAIEKPVIITG